MKEKEITIETPEKITFSYTLAQVGTRIAAFVIDILIQFAVILLFVLIIVLVGFPLFSYIGNDDSDLSLYAYAFYLLLIFFLQWFYFVFFEVKMEGQSPGKKAMRIRVIKSTGGQLDFETIVLRNLLRAVDGFPTFHLVGGFVAIIDRLHRRLGDILAGTIVVNEIYFDLKEPDFFVKFQHGRLEEIEAVSLKLDEEELYIIRRFLNEHHKMPGQKQKEVAWKLAGQVKERLKMGEPIHDPILYLERIYRHHGS